MEITSAQQTLLTVTTESTSTSTGSVVISGGLGVAKNVYVGERLFTPNNYAFKATFSAIFNPVGLAFTLPFDTVSATGCYQRGGTNFAVGTNTFTAPIAGLYEFYVALLVSIPAGTTQAILFINPSINGAIRLQQIDNGGIAFGSRQMTMMGGITLNLAANETVSSSMLFVGATATQIVASQAFTYFTGRFLG